MRRRLGFVLLAALAGPSADRSAAQAPSPAPIERTSPRDAKELDLERMLDLLRKGAVSKSFADRFSRRFMAEPSLSSAWARARSRESSTARELLAGLRAQPRWRALLAEFAQDPEFRGSILAIQKDPEIARVVTGYAAGTGFDAGLGLGDPDPGRGDPDPGRGDPDPGRGGARLLPRETDRGWTSSVFPLLTGEERARVDRSCFQDERRQSFWDCCATAAIRRCDDLCKDRNCDGPPLSPPSGQPEKEPFDWAKANELRHKLLGQGDERGSYAQINRILRHSLMDPYMLQLLSGWEIPGAGADAGARAAKAIANLLAAARRYPELRFIAAAARVAAAGLAAGAGDAGQARMLYSEALGLPGRGLDGYRSAARAGLDGLSGAPEPFDWAFHNELRHQLQELGDQDGSRREIDLILRRSIMDPYMLSILSGWTLGGDPSTAAGRLAAAEAKEPRLPFISAAVHIQMGDLARKTGHEAAAAANYRLAASAAEPCGSSPESEPGAELCAYRTLALSRLAALESEETGGGSAGAWPNTQSRAISDPWIARHHDSIREMHPKVLALNFVNGRSNADMEALLGKIFAALKEASRYHGYADPRAPAFLHYSLAASVDLTDHPPPQGWSYRNSSKYPRRPKGSGGAWQFDYARLFSREFAESYAIADPEDPSRRLTLCELLDRGIAHEVWVYGDADVPDVNAAEVLENKQTYDERNAPVKGRFNRCAGNGCFDSDVPACGRTVRIAWVNNTRGPGCLVHSLGHGVEGQATSGAIPYFTANFRHFANFDLDSRLGLPFSSWYGACGASDCLSYPGPNSVRWATEAGASGTVASYDQGCGNVHFSPNSRRHYDDQNIEPVLSTCEHFGLRDGSAGKDRAELYTRAKADAYGELAPDCEGPWLVYWMQSFPGYRNQARGADGTPMKNWWPFWFY